MSTRTMEVWAIAREARRRAGLTQRRLAELSGTSRSAIARYELGQAMPNFPTLSRIARACGLDLRVAPDTELGDDEGLLDIMLAMSVEDRLRTARNFALLASQIQRS